MIKGKEGRRLGREIRGADINRRTSSAYKLGLNSWLLLTYSLILGLEEMERASGSIAKANKRGKGANLPSSPAQSKVLRVAPWDFNAGLGAMIKGLNAFNKFSTEAKLGQNGVQIGPEDTVKDFINA